MSIPFRSPFVLHRLLVLMGLVGLFATLAASGAAQAPSYTLFDSGPVRPIALSPSGARLFVANTPAGQLEVFDVTPQGLHLSASVAVGLEPVTVATRTEDEVWVVNHLSDSVSIVDVSAEPPQVTRTLLVGDEPRDLVFAGTGGTRAFVSTAHRGQHRVHPSIAAVPGAGDPQLTTEGIGRADVWVFDATSPGAGVGGTPLEILTFFADTPRALAASPDGSTVYVAAFLSGNQTTALNDQIVCDGFDGSSGCATGPGGVPGPDDNASGDPAPETGLIVKFDGADWRDAAGRSWSAAVPFDLPDHDVFSIDADTLAPASVQTFDHVGTVLFNMAVNPVTGKVYVTNTELPNHVRFEGPGDHGGSTVQGHLSESRITVLDPAGPSVDPNHLNQHIDYAQLHTDPGANHAAIDAQAQHSLATPLQPVVSSDGSTLYVPAFGSGKIGVFDVADIEDPSFEANFDPTAASADYLSTGGGPAGIAIDETASRAYVWTRFANQVEIIDLASRTTLAVEPLYDPEPPSIVEGRPFLYDARISSGNGETSCASCHVFGDLDGLAWNLGDPDAEVTQNEQPGPPGLGFLAENPELHPMKGPMTTQTLRGLSTHGALHWRGDRVDGFFGLDSCAEPTGAACSEDFSFRNFIVAFEGLLGKHGTISASEMRKFADFQLQVRLPPNPVRQLDHSLSPQQAAGESVFFGPVTDTVANCNGCHVLDPASGFFGTSGGRTVESEPQEFKVAHMRNLYAKIGMFGLAGGPHLGDQVRGFGFLHDGSVPTVKDFLSAAVFSLSSTEEQDLEAFSLVFPTDHAPIVGQQVTRTASNGAEADPRIDLLLQRAGTTYASLVAGGAVPECDVVVKGSVGGEPRGWVRRADGSFDDDLGGSIAEADLRALAATEGALTYTCVPPGSGERAGIDRDLDTALDGLDNCPAVPNAGGAGTCTVGDQALLATPCTTDAACGSGGVCSLAQEDADVDGTGDACETELVPEPGGAVAWAAGVLGLRALARLRRRRGTGRAAQAPPIG